MIDESKICCCGASTWAKVIAWWQMIGNTIMSIAAIFFGFIYNDHNYYTGTNVWIIILIFSVFGVFTGIVLLKGTIDKRIGFLKIWLIYGFAAAFFSPVSLIVRIASDISVTADDVISGLSGTAVNVFSIVVVFIHISEIKKGVFIIPIIH